tara:strand:+ start:210 stop:1280 length:1071 start_codon:yes stop_codon:yes gene_type:complete
VPRPTAPNPLTALLGIDHPVIQGPFGGGLSRAGLTAAVSNKGGLGSFGAEPLSPREIEQTARDIRALTDRPFNLNLWVSRADAGGARPAPRDLERAWRLFEPYFAELGLARPDFEDRPDIAFADQADAVLAARPAVFSFVFGIPPVAVLRECRRLAIVTMGAATSVAEAEALDAAGVDLIIATGLEAGGHRVSFLGRAEDQLMGTFALTQLIGRRVKKPVIAAGGIADGAGVRAARALGAAGAQVGTAFLACGESGADDLHRAALFGPGAARTELTRAVTGRLARCLANRWIDEMANRAADLAPFPVQGWYFAKLKAASAAAGHTDFHALYGGQIAPNLRHRQAGDLMDDLISGTA